ncbi:MAG TPA: lipoate--protein ligase family protein [Pirellulaceae bacterium]|nr:lipoate--protein ligase family protein [Pirellulaceae bacterium]
MKLLDLTLPTPTENLALDQALLDAAEAGELEDEVLRLWEPAQPVVVVGRGSRVEEEVDVAACRSAGVPILRRDSGGAAIVTGPGCLMYGVVLRYEARQHLRMIDEAHRHVLGIVARAISRLVPSAAHCGTSDLAIGDRKFSGNSLRCKREHLLYHGTLLYDFDLPLIGGLLRMPPRQPAYRAGRRHTDFVVNLPASREQLEQALCSVFAADQRLESWPDELTQRLVKERYALDAWHLAR